MSFPVRPTNVHTKTGSQKRAGHTGVPPSVESRKAPRGVQHDLVAPDAQQRATSVPLYTCPLRGCGRQVIDTNEHRNLHLQGNHVQLAAQILRTPTSVAFLCSKCPCYHSDGSTHDEWFHTSYPLEKTCTNPDCNDPSRAAFRPKSCYFNHGNLPAAILHAQSVPSGMCRDEVMTGPHKKRCTNKWCKFNHYAGHISIVRDIKAQTHDSPIHTAPFKPPAVAPTPESFTTPPRAVHVSTRQHPPTDVPRGGVSLFGGDDPIVPFSMTFRQPPPPPIGPPRDGHTIFQFPTFDHQVLVTPEHTPARQPQAPRKGPKHHVPQQDLHQHTIPYGEGVVTPERTQSYCPSAPRKGPRQHAHHPDLHSRMLEHPWADHRSAPLPKHHVSHQRVMPYDHTVATPEHTTTRYPYAPRKGPKHYVPQQDLHQRMQSYVTTPERPQPGFDKLERAIESGHVSFRPLRQHSRKGRRVPEVYTPAPSHVVFDEAEVVSSDEEDAASVHDGVDEDAASVHDGVDEDAASVHDGVDEDAASVHDGVDEDAASVQDGPFDEDDEFFDEDDAESRAAEYDDVPARQSGGGSRGRGHFTSKHVRAHIANQGRTKSITQGGGKWGKGGKGGKSGKGAKSSA